MNITIRVLWKKKSNVPQKCQGDKLFSQITYELAHLRLVVFFVFRLFFNALH